MYCPIGNCHHEVRGPLRVCSDHYKLIPAPQREALGHYARVHKGGPAHRATFVRAMESIQRTLEFHASMKPVVARSYSPYKDE